MTFDELASRACPEPNTGRGYGVLRHGGSNVRAHRLSWQLSRGPLGAGVCVLHRCDTPACINPGHLFVGTQADNMADMCKKGRVKPGMGERHGMSRLLDAEVREIRSLYEQGMLQRTIAVRFGVTRGHVGRILRGQLRRSS